MGRSGVLLLIASKLLSQLLAVSALANSSISCGQDLQACKGDETALLQHAVPNVIRKSAAGIGLPELNVGQVTPHVAQGSHPASMVIFDFDGTLQNNYLNDKSYCPSEHDIIYNSMKQMYLLSLPFAIMSKHFEGPGGIISPKIDTIIDLLSDTNKQVMSDLKTTDDLFYAAALDKHMDKGALMHEWTSKGLESGSPRYVMDSAKQFVPRRVVFVDDTKKNLDAIRSTLSKSNTKFVTDCDSDSASPGNVPTPYVWLVIASSRFGENCADGQPIDCPAATHPPQLKTEDPTCQSVLCIDDCNGYCPKGCQDDPASGISCTYPTFKFSNSQGACSGRYKEDDGGCQGYPELARLASNCCGLSPGPGGQWYTMLNALRQMIEETQSEGKKKASFPAISWSMSSPFPYLTYSK